MRISLLRFIYSNDRDSDNTDTRDRGHLARVSKARSGLRSTVTDVTTDQALFATHRYLLSNLLITDDSRLSLKCLVATFTSFDVV